MIKIRILAKYSYKNNFTEFPDAEIFIEDQENLKGGVEEIRVVSGALIKNYIKEWNVYVKRILILKQNSPDDLLVDKEIQSKLIKKSNSLKSLLFQNLEPFGSIHKLNSSRPILFVTDPEFAAVPYEILPSNKNLLYKNNPVIRQIRSERVEKSRHKKKGILLVSNFHENKIITESVKEECYKIKEILSSKFKEDDLISLSDRNLTRSRFLEELPNISYLHYAGHSERSGIQFSDGEMLTDTEIGKLGLGNLKIVFFNSCFSGFHSKEIVGLAAAFLKSGATHFIGYSQQVSSDVAKFIGVRFWNKFLTGVAIEKIIFEMRKEISEKFGEGETATFTLCHFGPEFRKDKWFVSRKLFISALALFMALIAGSYLLWKNFNTGDVTNVAYRDIIKNSKSDAAGKIPLNENFENNPKSSKNLSGNKFHKAFKRNRKYPNYENDIFEEVKIEQPAEVSKSKDSVTRTVKKENPPSISKPYIPKNLKEMISEIKSPQLKNAVEKFLNEEHTLIGFEVRKRIVQDILQLDENEDFKYYQFKNKTGFSN
ncbi:MAG: CHAT domain-containing protein [Leptospiraceae bacterium]|nr:CHAT domain-containing protein [Leptospiraceae bacterium]MCK6380720.1 CHAT domain-containing protein [Leptospiraceae bacterium]NUM41235.1 CHAT domain-containing protein [Leptospiraceae bacterium]